eukprot:s20_g7.t1
MTCTDAAFRENLLKAETIGELKYFRDPCKPLSDEERRKAIAGLNGNIRPRSAHIGVLPIMTRTGSAPNFGLGEDALTPGSPVRLSKLRSRAEFNGTTFGEVVESEPDARGQLLVRLFPREDGRGDSSKLVWVSKEKLSLETSPTATRAGRQWLNKPLRHVAHHALAQTPNGGFCSEGSSTPLLFRDTQRLYRRE